MARLQVRKILQGIQGEVCWWIFRQCCRQGYILGLLDLILLLFDKHPTCSISLLRPFSEIIPRVSNLVPVKHVLNNLSFLFCYFLEIEAYSVAQTGLKLVAILLPQPLEY